MSTLGIYKKMHAIMKKVAYLEKQGKNAAQGYRFLSERQIKEVLHREFVEHGVVPYFSSKQTGLISIGKTKSGSDMWLAQVETTFRFIDIDDGSVFEGVTTGHGADTGDKGVYKAITGSIKYALSSSFLIASGDDPENEEETSAIQTDEPRYEEPFPDKEPEHTCPQCKQGQLKEKQGKYGTFMGCSRYPDCKYIQK